MNASSLYAGPGKIRVQYNSTPSYINMFPQGEAGDIKMTVNQETDDVGNAIAGHIDVTAADCTIKVDVTPFDNWGLFDILFPATIVTPSPGTRFCGANNFTTTIWATDGRLFTIQNAFISKQPEIHLGNGVNLWGATEITGVVKDGTDEGTAASFYAVASGQADPGAAAPADTMSDFIREPWTLQWGAVAGFGALTQAEDEIVIVPEVKYVPLKVQKLTRAYMLQSVKFMVKLRPVGPTQANIDNALQIQNTGLLGRRLGVSSGQATSLVLTGSISGKTITLPKVNLVTAGYEFGGSKLGNGEIGFVANMTFSAGAVQALISHT